MMAWVRMKEERQNEEYEPEDANGFGTFRQAQLWLRVGCREGIYCHCRTKR